MGKRLPTVSQGVALAAGAFFAPTRIWASNLKEIGFPRGLLLWSLLVWAAALLLWWLFVRIGFEPQAIAGSLFWLILGVGATGPLVNVIPGGVVALLGLLVTLAVIVYRLRGITILGWITTWTILFVVLLSVGLVVAEVFARGPSVVAAEVDVEVGVFEQSPDVVIVVLDGFASPTTLEEQYGFDSTWLETMRDAGLDVSMSMRANYTLSHLSLASLFRMDYPLDQGAQVGDADWVELLSAIRGDNALVRAFRANGYRFVLVESGWSAIRCSGFVDQCIRGVWPDDATSLAIRESALAGIFPTRLAESATRGTLNSVGWLRDALPEYLNNSTPELVFAHLLLPHPPFRLDETCEYRLDEGTGGTVVVAPGMSQAEIIRQRLLYADQVRCAQQVMVTLASLVGKDAVLVVLGDHGPDSHAQLFTEPKEWSESAMRERFGTLLATNWTGCGIEDQVSLVNVGRALVGCLRGVQLKLQPDRFFISVNGLEPGGRRGEPLYEVRVPSG